MISSTPNRNLSVYMDPIEFSQMVAILEATQPRRVLEWGSGGSTQAMLAQCPYIERLVSIEHSEKWHREVKARVLDPRLELQWIPPDRPLPDGASKAAQMDWDMKADEDPSLMVAYVQFPRTLGISFDFVLVDGRARNFCMPVGYELLAPGGVLVLHDAQRTEYHETLRRLGRAAFLEPWKKGQICLVRKPTSVGISG